MDKSTGSHTPGPWICNKLGLVSADAGSMQIARVGAPSEDPDENVSNGLLIAAAPELLEALEKIADLRGRTVYRRPENDGQPFMKGANVAFEQAADIADAAIAKATDG